MKTGVDPVWKSASSRRAEVCCKRDRGKNWAFPAAMVQRSAERVDWKSTGTEEEERAGKRAAGQNAQMRSALGRNPEGGMDQRTWPNRDAFVYPL